MALRIYGRYLDQFIKGPHLHWQRKMLYYRQKESYHLDDQSALTSTMNLPIMDENDHTDAPNEDSSAAPSTTIDRVQQLLALPVSVDVTIDRTGSSTSATKMVKSAALLQDEYLWASWHLNGKIFGSYHS